MAQSSRSLPDRMETVRRPRPVGAHIPKPRRSLNQLVNDIQVLLPKNPLAIEALAAQAARFRQLASFPEVDSEIMADRDVAEAQAAGARLIEFIQLHTTRWPAVVCATERVVIELMVNRGLIEEILEFDADDVIAMISIARLMKQQRRVRDRLKGQP